MPPSNRLFNKGEKKHFIYSADTVGPHKYFYLKMGVIEEIDFDKYEMTIVWLDKSGSRPNVPISFAYASPAGCLGGLPEKGSIGIFGFYNEGGNRGFPLLLSYLPSGLFAGLNFNSVQINPDSLPTDDINLIEFKFRKLGPGDMIMSSSLGSSIFLNGNIEIRDGKRDSIEFREGDQAIFTTSLNNYIFANGAAVSAGPAVRNLLPIYDENGKRLQNNGSILPLISGKDNIYIVPHGQNIVTGTKYYTEYRIDADELGDGKNDLNEINSSSPLSTRKPIVTMALGNYIGADRFNPQTYGYNLKARLFTSSDDQRGGFGLEHAQQNNGVDEPSINGLAYALHFLKNDSFMGVDKEGHYYVNLPASKANPLGAGRSMSMLAAGNLKEIWGQTATDSNSWDLTTKGGIRWNVGAHNSKRSGRSIDITTSKGINILVGGSDDKGFAKTEFLVGNVQETVLGNKFESCSSSNLLISGLKFEEVMGNSAESIQGLKSIGATTYSEVIVKDFQSKMGSRKTIVTTGDDDTTLLKGSIKETILGPAAGKSTTVATGSIEEKIVAGNRTTSIGTGFYKVDVKAGTITLQTNGLVTVSGSSVSVNGKIIAAINAPIVTLGNNAVKGGVVTGLPGLPSQFCYVSGIPLKGSLSVFA